MKSPALGIAAPIAVVGSRMLRRLRRSLCVLVSIAMPMMLGAACQSPPQVAADEAAVTQDSFMRGPGRFVFDGWAGPPITVWTYAPESGSLADLPVVVVMHGVNRDGDRYRDEWIKAAREHDLIILAPSFSSDDFPKAAGYNLGNMFDENSGAAIGEELWSFSAIDPLFDEAVKRLGGAQTSYALYGHSAGAQFVHRYLYFKPKTHAGLLISANAGWYTTPDFGMAFPYGLEGSGLDPTQLEHALGSNVVVLLGDRDTDEQDPNLRRTPEAMAQGPHRHARGKSFFQAASKLAAESGVEFGWRQVDVPLAHHSNALMAPAAAQLIRDWAAD